MRNYYFLSLLLALPAGCAPSAPTDEGGQVTGELSPIDSTKDASRAMSLTAAKASDSFSYTCLAGPTNCQLDLTALFQDKDIKTKLRSAPLQADPDWQGGKVRRSVTVTIANDQFVDMRSFGWHTPAPTESMQDEWYQDGSTSALMTPGVYTVTVERDAMLPAGFDPLRLGLQVKSKQLWCTEVKCYDSPDGDFSKRSMVTGTINMHVTGTDGQPAVVPAANMVVQLDSYVGSIGTTMTDDQGQFVFNSLALGEYKLTLPELNETQIITVATSPRQPLAPLTF